MQYERKESAMSTSTLSHPNGTHLQNIVVIGSVAILILTSLALIASTILNMISSTTRDEDAIQADLIPVVQNSINPLPVPTPPMANIYPSPFETPGLAIVGTSERSVLPVPVPNSPSS